MVAMATSFSTAGPPSNTQFLRPIRFRAYNPNGFSIGSAAFAQMTAECPILYNGTPLSTSKLTLLVKGSGPPSNTWFPGPILHPNGISIGAAVFTRLTTV